MSEAARQAGMASKDTSKPSFASVASVKEESAPVPDREPLKPGWVRLFKGPNGETLREEGPPVPEPEYLKRMREIDERRARQQLISSLERSIAYAREMDPYYDDYNPDQDDYESEEVESDHEYVAEYASDYDDDDYGY